ncbi:MAG: 2-C-methyl-D-erythritol 2,4-cyclodiphosphate synthase [Gammaproteobacteria bacterium]|nr:2-C-methyl-D-erythritol 2,4-cyclodiphosphate synthase [Gammaproteobacteria bacterium]NVK87020.1 2-C-methyl-D-erythritol 2,4-cyclodiphosphate synthase [Gammaproteobacteria bacterium]
MRIGHGFDAHKFGGNRPLILGGVTVPSKVGLLAHSDGDVVLHAVCDAILGAIGAGDIGHHFSDQEAEFAGIDSRELLRRVVLMMRKEHFVIGNLDITIVAQAPKLAPYIAAMKTCLAEDLGTRLTQLNVKATTTEKMGYIGRKEGIAVHAVVLLNAMSETENG